MIDTLFTLAFMAFIAYTLHRVFTAPEEELDAYIRAFFREDPPPLVSDSGSDTSSDEGFAVVDDAKKRPSAPTTPTPFPDTGAGVGAGAAKKDQ